MPLAFYSLCCNALPAAKDTAKIFADSGQQVTARCQGSIKLLLKAPYQCSDAVFNAGTSQLLICSLHDVAGFQAAEFTLHDVAGF